MYKRVRVFIILCSVVPMALAACQSEGGATTPTADASTTASPSASTTPLAEASSTDSALAGVQRPLITPTVSLAEAQPAVDATSLPTAFDGPLPSGAVARYGTGILMVDPAEQDEELASPDGRYIAIPSGAGMHFYRTDTGKEEWTDGLDQLVSSIVWSPDSSLLAAGSMFGEIVIWDVQVGKRLHTVYAHNGATVDTLDWSPDGKVLASGGFDTRVILWNPRAGAALHVLEGDWDGSVASLVFSSDSTKILASYVTPYTDAPRASHPPTVWDIQSGKLLYTLELSQSSYWLGTLRSNHWSADGRLLLADETIYEAATGNVINTLDALDTGVWSPAVSLLAVAEKHQVGVWDAQARQLLWSQESDSRWPHLIWSSDGASLLEVNTEGARLWDAHSGQLLRTITHEVTGRYIWFRDGTLMAIEGDDEGYQLAATFDVKLGGPISETTGSLVDIAWSPDRAVLVTSPKGLVSESVSLTDLQTREKINGLVGTDYVLGLAWSPDGASLAVASTNSYQRHQVTLWDVQTHSALANVALQDRSDYLSWSPDGKFLAAGWPTNTTIMDRAGVLLPPASLPAGSPVVFSPQGTLLLADRTVWDTASGRASSTLSLPGTGWQDVAWSPDGTMLATAGSNGDPWSSSSDLIVWDAQTGSPIHSLEGHYAAVNSVAWSPDGTRVVSGASGEVGFDETTGWPVWANEAIVWDVSSGRSLLTLSDESLELTDVAWSPDGLTLAVAYGADPLSLFGNGYFVYLNPGKVTLLDAQTGQLVEEFKGHSTSVQCIAFSPDGSQLASGSLDGTVIVWDVH